MEGRYQRRKYIPQCVWRQGCRTPHRPTGETAGVRCQRPRRSVVQPARSEKPRAQKQSVTHSPRSGRPIVKVARQSVKTAQIMHTAKQEVQRAERVAGAAKKAVRAADWALVNTARVALMQKQFFYRELILVPR